MPTEFRLPELGENVTTGEVLRVLVKPGDVVTEDQPILELETDKATIEVPTTVGGRITELKVKAGDQVKVGQVILVVDGGGEGSPATAAGEPQQRADAGRSAADDKAAQERGPVGGADEQAAAPRENAADKPAIVRAERPETEESTPARVSESPRGRRGEVVEISRGARTPADAAPAPAPATPAAPAAPAAPSVRRLARELGVDINEVSGTGPKGRISADDVKAHVRGRLTGAALAGRQAPARPPPPDFSRWGPIERKPMSGVRRKTGEHLAQAWSTIPHVTQHDRADITGLEAARQRVVKQADGAGGALTVTAIAVKVIASALGVFPQFNSSIDVESQEIVYKQYCHIGVAVDTERGLLVPIIRDADRKGLMGLARELSVLAEKARAGKLSLAEMQGGSFTISNLGGIGGTYFSPIVNAPEVAILGISRASLRPVYVDGQFQPRLLLPLSLSYDHRAIDGADAIRFLRWVIDVLEHPLLLALGD